MHTCFATQICNISIYNIVCMYLSWVTVQKENSDVQRAIRSLCGILYTITLFSVLLTSVTDSTQASTKIWSNHFVGSLAVNFINCIVVLCSHSWDSPCMCVFKNTHTCAHFNDFNIFYPIFLFFNTWGKGNKIDE